jgi:DAK2 domain fusion protein YloV
VSPLLQTLDSAAARRWARAALAALAEAREEIDALNVFPVPDGDTGTNMYLTLEAAVTAAAALPDGAPVDRLAEAFARGALLGARGNSGIISAQLLRGWAETLAQYTLLNAASAVEGFRRADEQAWKAVNDPVEGTILSVSRAAADAAADAEPTLRAVVSAAADAARHALELTPTQLPALARAGVVDAGGRGFVVLVESLADLVLGASRSRPSRSRPSRGHRPTALPAVRVAPCGEVDDPSEGPAYEVMFLLETDPGQEVEAIRRLRSALAALGESLVVVGGGGVWQVHVHADDPGAVVEAAIDAGRPYRIRISHFAEQIAARRKAGIGLVACAAGPGLAELFEGVGAAVVAGGPGRRPSTAQILDAVRRTGAGHVVLLPNDGDTLNVARVVAASARAAGIRVAVVPTRAQVRGLAAAAVHDPGRSFEDDVAAMSAAAGAARDGAVTFAVRDGLTSAGPCRTGDVLGVVDGDFALVGSDLTDVALNVVERLLWPGGELVTLVMGAGSHENLARAVAAHLHTAHRHLEVQVLDGGQPRYPLLIGVE